MTQKQIINYILRVSCDCSCALITHLQSKPGDTEEQMQRAPYVDTHLVAKERGDSTKFTHEAFKSDDPDDVISVGLGECKFLLDILIDKRYNLC